MLCSVGNNGINRVIRKLAPGLLLLVVAVAIPFGSAKAVEPSGAAERSIGDRLREFQQQTRSLRGQFQQQIIESNGLVDDEPRSGEFWVERPNKIRWHYRQPYEQLIVADGVKVWLFDPDLDQVLVRDLETDSDDVAGLLLGSSEDITQRFTVTSMSANQYLLVPLAAESVIEQVVIEFEQQLMVSLEVRDKLGTTSKFEFFEQQANPDINPKQFRFIAPDGVDVVIQ